jgi:hypothetical protein
MGVRRPLLALFAVLLLSSALAFPLKAQEITAEETKPLRQTRIGYTPVGVQQETYGRKGPDIPGIQLTTPLLQTGRGFDFVDNGAQTGFVFIPPDPIVSAGLEHVLNVGNVLVEWRPKMLPDTAQVQMSLFNFFAPIPGPSSPVLPTERLGTWTFDSKCIHDQYADRFIVIALEQWDDFYGDPSDESRILIAVSKTPDPNAGWWYHTINTKLLVGNIPAWADYPGIAIDDKAIYLTANMFEFAGSTPTYASLLWIINKVPFYSGPDQSAVITLYDPYAVTGTIATTTQPAHMWGPLPAALGTYLVSYSGLSSAGSEFVQVIEVTDPLALAGGPFFGQQYVPVGNIDNTAAALPDAPQLGSVQTIEVNDRRALNAVWRDNSLYMSSTVMPVLGPDAGQATAHWWELNTTLGPGSFIMTQQADVGAEDLGPGTYTFFPAVMADGMGNVGVGFSASNATIYCGAYYAARNVMDPLGTMQGTQTMALGTDWYYRTFGGTRNRWGDYSGLALCPVDESTMWVYNEYACERGSPIGGEDGRWCTQLGTFRVGTATGVPPTPDVDDLTLDQNFPNPFNPITSIRFTIESSQDVTIAIYDVRGRLVRMLLDEARPPGENFVRWDGTNEVGVEVASGIYYYALTAGGAKHTRKMVFLK